jgi:hypothetical protein
MTYSKEKDEIDYAYKIRRAMNESTEAIPQATLDRLAQARQIALSRKKEETPSAVFAFSGALASNGGTSFTQSNWFKKISLTIPLIVLIGGLYGIYNYEKEQQINDLAEIDAAVLVDELPPDAYLDEGFNAYLNKEEQQKEKN